MSWLTNLFTRAQQTTVTFLDWMGLRAASMEDVTDTTLVNAFHLNPWVYACVRRIAETAASCPIKVQTQTKKTEWEDADTSELDSLLQWTNSRQDVYQLVEETISWLTLYGNAFWLPLRASTKGTISGLQVFPATQTKPRVKRDGSGIEWEFTVAEGRVQVKQPDEIVHFKLWSPIHEYVGQSPIQALEQTINAYTATMNYNASHAKAGGVPSTVMHLEEKLTTERAQEFREMWRQWRGDGKSGLPLFLGSGMKFEVLGSAPDSTYAIEFPRFLRDTIVGVLQVPPTTVGILDRATYSNVEAEKRALWTECVIPMLTRIAAGINGQLVPMLKLSKPQRAVFDWQAVPTMQAMMAEAASGQTALVAGGILTPNEVREGTLSREPVPWGDAWWGSFSMAPLASMDDDGLREPEPPPEPAPVEEQVPVDVPKESEGQKTGGLLLVSRKATPKRLTPAQRRQHMQVWDKAWESQIDQTAKWLQPWFDKLVSQTVASLEKQPSLKAERRLADPSLEALGFDEKEAAKLLRDLMGGPLEDGVQSGGSLVSKLYTLQGGITFTPDTKRFQQFLLARDRNFKTVAQTMQQSVRNTLRDGLASGDNLRDLTVRVREWGATASDYEAERIARTEIAAAMNEGSRDAYAQADAGQEWMSVLDDKTRDGHAEMDGRVVGPGEQFEFVTVDGNTVEIDGPHDSSLGAGDVVHCRCVTAPVITLYKD